MTVYERNVEAGALIEYSEPAGQPADSAPSQIVIEPARDGSLTMAIERPGRRQYLHSPYSPRREGERLAAACAREEWCLALGFGLGWHVQRMLERGCDVAVVEPDRRMLRAALERVDVSAWLSAGTLSFHSTARTALDRFMPGYHASLRVVDLPGRLLVAPDGLSAERDRIAHYVDQLRTDLAVQCRFARAWARNTAANLADITARPRLGAAPPPVDGRRVTVAAAGPSLETAVPRLARVDRRRELIVAVDSALPVLLDHGVTPDLSITVDCQLAGYHHFLAAGFPRIPVIADLSVTPSLFGRLPLAVPALTGHPLHRLVATLYPGCVDLDVSGGNVTYAAVAYALAAAAAAVDVVGADFCYPAGLTYPRGSYVHRYIESRADRLSPIIGRHLAFLLDRPGVYRDPDRPDCYLQPSLLAYRQKLEALLAARPTPSGHEGRPEAPTDARRESSPEPVAPPPAGLLDTLRRLAAGVSAAHCSAGSTAGRLERLAARALLPQVVALRAAQPAAGREELFDLASRELTAFLRSASSTPDVDR